MEHFRNLIKNKSSLVSMLFIFFLLSSSILIPFISPYVDDINGAVNFKKAGQPPSFEHWFGTDVAGRDMFTLTIRSGLSSFKIAAGVVIVSILIGVPIGLFSGISSRRVDGFIMRINDALLSFPPLILPFLITTALGPSTNHVIFGIAISWFPWYVRIARARAMVINSLGFVLMSKSMGAGKLFVLMKHILPNSISPVLVQGTMDAGYAILTAAGLSFIGLGAQHPETEWGLLLTQSRAQFMNNWWEAVFPGLFIVFTVVSFNVIGEQLRYSLNPKEEIGDG